jgi:uncharacterized protein (UPF0218 family)
VAVDVAVAELDPIVLVIVAVILDMALGIVVVIGADDEGVVVVTLNSQKMNKRPNAN